MRGRGCCVVMLCTWGLPGCGLLPTPGATSDGWLTRARRQLAQVARDIEADLDFHENEGLEAFDPGAVRQVNAMRSDMNGTAGITR